MALTQISTQGIKDGTITGSDLATNVDLVDNQNIRLGTGNDMSLYHDGTNSIIANITGPLALQSNDLQLTDVTNSHPYIKCVRDAQVELYFDNSKKLRTKTAGIEIIGDLGMADNHKIRLGTAEDLEIFHDGSHSRIVDSGTGFLVVQSSRFQINNAANTENMAAFIENGAVELYFDNSKKLETTANGTQFDGRINFTGTGQKIDLIDNQEIRIGTGDDLQIFHTGTASKINNATGSLFIQSDAMSFHGEGGSETMAVFAKNGAVELYHDNAKKFETYTGGCIVTGGTGSSSLKLNTSDGTLRGYIYGDSNNHVFLLDGQGHSFVKGIKDGAVELYFDNSKKLETTSAGVTIEGSQHRFKGDVRFDNNTNTERDIFFDESEDRLNFFDNVKATFGNSNDLQIFHDGTDSKITNTTGALDINGSGNINIGKAGENGIKVRPDNAVELYFDNSLKFKTDSIGCEIAGALIIPDGSASSNRISVGNGADLKIYSDGTNGILEGGGSGANAPLFLNANTIRLQTQSGGEMYIDCQENGAVELFHNDSKKFETQSTGAKVTGALSVTGAISTDNEFNMTAQGNKFIDTAHLNHTLHFRRINDGDNGHANQCTVSSDGVWSADFNDTSDEKLKENITTISDGAINIVKQLRPVNFDWKETDKANNVSGFIAQEIKTVLPNLVYGTEYDPTIVDEKTQCIKSTGYSVNTIGIVAHLTKALQEAITKIEVLETEVAALKAG